MPRRGKCTDYRGQGDGHERDGFAWHDFFGLLRIRLYGDMGIWGYGDAEG